MGKKPQKTKELWAAIAESSSTIDETSGQQQQQPPQAGTRKRGRPRKIINVKMEISAEEKAAQGIVLIEEEQPAVEQSNKLKENSMEKAGEEKLLQEGTSSPTCMRRDTIEEMQLMIPKGESLRSSRARRKSKPRKSSTQ